MSSSKRASGAIPRSRAICCFPQAELLFEPAHHPEPAIDHDLGVVGARQGAGVGRHEGFDLHVLRVGRVHGGRGAVAQTGGFRRPAAGPQHFAGLVRGRGDHRQALGDAGLAGRFAGDVAQEVARRHQLRQESGVQGKELPLEVPRPGPAMALVVEGHIAHLTAHGIAVFAGQAVNPEAR